MKRKYLIVDVSGKETLVFVGQAFDSVMEYLGVPRHKLEQMSFPAISRDVADTMTKLGILYQEKRDNDVSSSHFIPPHQIREAIMIFVDSDEVLGYKEIKDKYLSGSWG